MKRVAANVVSDSRDPRSPGRPVGVGVIGYGAFGELTVQHLLPYLPVRVFDICPDRMCLAGKAGAVADTLEVVAASPIVVLAIPIGAYREVARRLAQLVNPGAVIIDVGSVKVTPANIMVESLPDYVDLIATHPLFGPQSAAHGIAGLKIAVCPLRGHSYFRIAAFIRRVLGLRVFFVTPDQHDREAAVVQGLTHLIAKILSDMEPLPTQLTTRSYELLMEAKQMVSHDAPEVFWAIERENPYVDGVRDAFFETAKGVVRNLKRH